jgi:uncharacterized protein (DUF302 family)
MRTSFFVNLFAATLYLFTTVNNSAAQIAPRDGWQSFTSSKPYAEMVQSVIAATKAEGLFVVTQAGPTKAAANRGITIPGNRVIGVFNNDFAVKILATSTAAMIEAPVRFYVTENSDGSCTLSYKEPSFVFAPYADEGGAELQALAAELDARFEAIAARALQD